MYPTAAILSVLLLAAPDAAGAEPSTLHVAWVTDGTITAAAGAVWLTTELLKPQLAPATCRWCDRDASGQSTLNAFDAWGRNARWDLAQQGTADVLSSVDAFVLAPAAAFGLDLVAAEDAGSRYYFEDALLIAESAALAGVANQATKFLVGRERPFVAALSPEERLHTASPSDNNLSFYSGHTSLAFSLAVAAGTVASERHYPLAWLVWAVGLPVAAGAGYLRIAADRHYLTDVLTGAALGAAFGYVVPVLHRRFGDPIPLTVSAIPGGASVSGTF